MRIRKRQVPFPLSSLSPIPLSDLHLNPSPPPVQHHHHHQHQHQHHHHHHHVHIQPSDQQNQRPSPIGNTPLDDFSTANDDGLLDVEKNKACLELMMMRKHEEDKRERREEEKKSNDIKNGSLLGAQTSTTDHGVQPLLSTSTNQVGIWCEGERAFPLKKRRGSFGRRSSKDFEDAADISMEIKENKNVMKTTKVNKKCVQQNDNGKDQERETNEEAGNDNDDKNIGAKKKGIVRGGAIMEGSRCSRVNGRGWRCCQQTLVGYSLCEHHLGKGRVRSMTSVRSRAMAATATTTTTTNTTTTTTAVLLNKKIGSQEKQPMHKLLNNEDDDEDEDEGDEDEKKPLMVTKKRMRLGMVKARSLSSLLGQPDNAVVVALADDNKNNNDE